MYEITLQDSTATLTLPAVEVPLVTEPDIYSTTVKTLSNDVRKHTTGGYRRSGTHTWAHLDNATYDALFQFYYRQEYVTFQYPQITVTGENINGMTAMIEVSPKQVIDECGNVQAVTLSWRESLQNPVEGS